MVVDAKCVFRRRHFLRLPDGETAAFERDVAQRDAADAFADENRAALKVVGGFEQRGRSDDFEIMSAGRESELRGDLDYSTGQADSAGRLRREQFAHTSLRRARAVDGPQGGKNTGDGGERGD